MIDELETMLKRMRELRNASTRDREIWRAFNEAADRLDVLISKMYQRRKPTE